MIAHNNNNHPHYNNGCFIHPIIPWDHWSLGEVPSGECRRCSCQEAARVWCLAQLHLRSGAVGGEPDSWPPMEHIHRHVLSMNFWVLKKNKPSICATLSTIRWYLPLTHLSSPVWRNLFQRCAFYFLLFQIPPSGASLEMTELPNYLPCSLPTDSPGFPHSSETCINVSWRL